MILRKLTHCDLHLLPTATGLCLLLNGPLMAPPEIAALPPEWAKSAPGLILCEGCDPFLERLLNARGVAVARPLDPVSSVPDSAEIEVDLAAGTLIEKASGRRFALKALKPSHLALIRAHG